VGVAVQTTATESVRVMLKEHGGVDRVVLRERIKRPAWETAMGAQGQGPGQGQGQGEDAK
jgi:hypothetical protein